MAPVKGTMSSPAATPMIGRDVYRSVLEGSPRRSCGSGGQNDTKLRLASKYEPRETDFGIVVVAHATWAAFLDHDVSVAGRRWRRQSHAAALSGGLVHPLHLSGRPLKEERRRPAIPVRGASNLQIGILRAVRWARALLET